MVLTVKITIESKITVSALSGKRPLCIFQSLKVSSVFGYRRKGCNEPIDSLEFCDAVTASCLPISSVFS